MSLQNPKTEFWTQNQYGRVIYHVKGSFTYSKKKYTLGGQKGENKTSVPKYGIWGPKSVWSCDIYIDRELYMQQENIRYVGRKGENKPSEPKNGIWGSKSIWSCDISIDREFSME
jgi:hypothetical protein